MGDHTLIGAVNLLIAASVELCVPPFEVLRIEGGDLRYIAARLLDPMSLTLQYFAVPNLIENYLQMKRMMMRPKNAPANL